MTLKTPEQIAAEVAGSYFDTYQDSAEEIENDEGQPIVETWPALRECIAAAIKADRAQLREVKAQAWREGWDASERFGYLDGVLETPLNPYLEADDDEEPTSDDERDYGKYLDQQFWGDH